jgi:glyoxylase-like metal-dependent hydrolase (beta-lactamase superfamily II)
MEMPAGAYRFEVGAIRCTVLADGYFSCPAKWFFPNADPVELAQALAERRLPQENILTPYACLLIQAGQRTILVDAGAGDSSNTTGALRARLEMEGVRPDDVDTVILTHAHYDHIGGAVDADGRLAFPQARHYLSELEWEFWAGRTASLEGLRVSLEVKDRMLETARRCLEALRARLEPIGQEEEICPGVRAIPAPGHTPGHLAVRIASDGQRLLHVGDAAVHPLHLARPDWENGFDLDPARSAETRRSLAEMATAEGMRLMAFHFPLPSVGSVTASLSGGWEWRPGQ